MEIFTERKSGIFLDKFGFKIVRSFYLTNKNGLEEVVKKVDKPFVMKIFGEKIVHKRKLGGVALNIRSYEEALKIFEKFKKIENVEGVVIQPELKSAPKGVHQGGARIPEGHKTSSRPRNIFQKKMFTNGMEFLVGIQKTADFGHVVAFGVGGSNVEKLKKVNFRVCNINKADALELINENFEKLEDNDKKILVNVLLKCCKLVKKFPKIKELDINPLVISKGKGIVLDSRIVFSNSR